MKATVVISSGASKRLIARGVAALENVRRAFAEGRVVVTLGTTNAFVAEELLGEAIDRTAFAAGFIDARWNINARLGEATEIVLENGRRIERGPEEVLASLRAGDVVIKGANALDPWGTAGVLLGAASGGTVGRYVAAALARGIDVVVPISVSKSVHTSIADLSSEMGIGRIPLHQGLPCGLFPLHGRVVTEIDAFEILFGIDAVHVASNGVSAGVGSVSLLLSGEEAAVRQAYRLAEDLSGEQDISLEGRA